MPKPTVYRILNTLETRGYVDRRPDGAYRMSEKLFTLQREKSIEEHLRTVAQPAMEHLC
jgi:DNA-binding IclR family transcriptional regulator